MKSLESETANLNPYFRNIRRSFEQDGLQNRVVMSALKGFLVPFWKLEESISREAFMDTEGLQIVDDPKEGLILMKNGEELPVQ